MATQPHKYTAATSNTHTIWYMRTHKYTWTQSHSCVICSSDVNVTLTIKVSPPCKHNKAWICLNSSWPPHQSIHVKADARIISLHLCSISNSNYVCESCCTGYMSVKSTVCVCWSDDICGDSSDIWGDERQTVKGGCLNTVQGPNLA